MRLENKVALITGGAAGIGKATAKRFAEEGATVIICDVNEEVGQKAADELGPKAKFYQVNVVDKESVRSWVDSVKSEFGRIDVLVNNAGIVRDSQLVKYKDGSVVGEMSEADWDLVINVNLKGVFNCTQAVVPTMIEQKSGAILNATSIVGLDGNFGQTNYVATKAGVVGMTKTWARELGKFGIRVNAIAPGFIATEIIKDMPEKVIQAMEAKTPLKRLGDPKDIADGYLFLASDEAAYVSGTVLRIDGGIVIGT